MGQPGRPKKYASGSAPWSGNLPLNVVRRLKDMDNASEWVSTVLTVALGTNSMDLTRAELASIDRDILALKKELLTFERRKAKLEDSLRTQQATKDGSMEARQRLFEDAIMPGPDRRFVPNVGWYQSRVDVLQECGFGSPEEAVEWQEQQLSDWKSKNMRR